MGRTDIGGNMERLSREQLKKALALFFKNMREGESLEIDGLIVKKSGEDVIFLKGGFQLSWEKLWKKPVVVYSYWILLIGGIHLKSQREIVSETLLWNGLNPEASVVFYQSNEEMFILMYDYFHVDGLPCIIASNNPDMTKGYIKFESKIIKEIQVVDNGITDLLTKLHINFKNRRTLAEMKKRIRSKRFWKGAARVYEELKDWRDLIKVFLPS